MKKQGCWLRQYWMATLILISGWCSAETAPVDTQLSVDAFLQQHWQRPLPPQGTPPASYSPSEASLSPKDCATCHAEQYNDWRTSLHSKAMGPGLMGQLITMLPGNRDEHQSCLRCHAPLAEQADTLVTEMTSGTEGLHRDGLVCAACHVRKHQRFGPARKSGLPVNTNEKLPHNGWSVSPAFKDSRFCASCHQFDPDGFSLNGKLLENTYEEWRSSRYAAEGISCQACHMPDRKHQWRGIHDPETVRNGVKIEVVVSTLDQPELSAQLQMTNTGTGHRFPTYVTPQVVMQAYQASGDGSMLDGTDRYFVVARRVALNLSAEIFDTRLAPDESAHLDYRVKRHADAKTLNLRVYVEPDTFYRLFFENLLSSGTDTRGTKMLKQALSNSQRSTYTLYEKQLTLP